VGAPRKRGVAVLGRGETLYGDVSALAPVEAHIRSELIEHAGRAGDVRELFRSTSERLRRLVPFDASVWLALDPATSLPIAPTRSEQLSHVCSGDQHSCLRVWELEFFVEDVNLYRDLARAQRPAGALRAATDDRPGRSARYREIIKPNGFEDELRAVMRVDGRPWASMGLYRERGRRPFTRADADLLAGLSGPVAAAVRDHSRTVTSAPAGTDARGPGVLLFDAAGELISINDAALAWLEEMPPEPGEAGAFSVRLPMVVASTLMRARAIAEERDHGHARARLRSCATGRWLVFHASCLRQAGGEIGNTALIIEPANPSEIAPIVAEAYQLTAREQQITELIARGVATAEIAERLFLSVHTVRDYIKAIFEKVRVSSRGELVATLFAEHVAPTHLAADAHERVDD
jgi:DNA-binding CsgD family transcriptional regulator